MVFLLIGTACDNKDGNKATNDSAVTISSVSTIDEVVITEVTETTEAPSVVEPTECETEHHTENATHNQQTIEDHEDERTDEEYQDSEYSESEIELIARTTYLESGNCGEYCQWLTASTILNLADSRGGIANVVYDYNTFNVSEMIDGCYPSDLSYSVAQRVASGDRDYNVMAFRAGYYHSFGTPYTNVDNVYFSTY